LLPTTPHPNITSSNPISTDLSHRDTHLPKAQKAVVAELAQTLDDGGVGHAAAFTHRLQPVPAPTLLERIDECGHDASTAGTQRVAECDSTTVDIRPSQYVGLLPIYVLGPRQHHRCEHLIVGWTAISLRPVGRADALPSLTC
jgi:hypothetical protein